MKGEDVEEDRTMRRYINWVEGLAGNRSQEKNTGGLSDVEKNDQRDGRI